jgi:hypothetical protein
MEPAVIRFLLTFRSACQLAAVLVFLVVGSSLSAQALHSAADTAAKPPKPPKTWQADVESKAIVQYDDNVFLLSPAQRGSLAAPAAGSVVSGRYDGMESANDVSGVGNIALLVNGPGFRGRTLEIVPEISYEYASRNQLRREAAGALSIAQSLGGGRRVRIKAGSLPSHFSRNYLADAVDADASGSISSSERIYKRGQYGEYSVGGDLRLPFGPGKNPSAVLGAGGGYYVRSYDAPFAVRDLSGPTAAVTLDLVPNSPVAFEIAYELAALSAARGNQVVLIDEPDYNIDFNGNGRATDLSARAVVDIDRSRIEHQVGGALIFDTGPRVTASVGYDYRMRSFSSTLPYDEADAGRRDNRGTVRGSLRGKITKGVYLSAGAKFLSQRTNRPLGSTLGDEADYRSRIASVGLQATF